MCSFGIEQAIRTWADSLTRFSFFWWIDLLGSASMFESVLPIFIKCQVGSTAALGGGSLQLTRVGRILRLLRVIRVVKVLQNCFKRRSEAEMTEEELEKLKEAPPSGAQRHVTVCKGVERHVSSRRRRRRVRPTRVT